MVEGNALRIDFASQAAFNFITTHTLHELFAFLLGHAFGCLNEAIVMATALSYGDVFSLPTQARPPHSS